jgi:hypothetical protein
MPQMMCFQCCHQWWTSTDERTCPKCSARGGRAERSGREPNHERRGRERLAAGPAPEADVDLLNKAIEEGLETE